SSTLLPYTTLFRSRMSLYFENKKLQRTRIGSLEFLSISKSVYNCGNDRSNKGCPNLFLLLQFVHWLRVRIRCFLHKCPYEKCLFYRCFRKILNRLLEDCLSCMNDCRNHPLIDDLH